MSVLNYNMLGNYLEPVDGNVSLSSSSTAFTISLSADAGFTGNLDVPYVNSYVFSTIYVKFLPTEAIDYSAIINHKVSGISKDLNVIGTVPDPEVSVYPAFLSFGDVQISTTSTEQTYTISGSHLGLSGSITIFAPSGFEISQISGSGFSSSSTISFTGGSFSSTTIYVHFVPLIEQLYTGSITTNLGSTVSVSGNGVAEAPDRYWVGGTGDWSDDEFHWALVSGGEPGIGNLPNSGLNVFIDANSGFEEGGYINTADFAFCKNFTANSGHTYTIYGDLYIYGNAIFEPGLTFETMGT